jgi:hypothetical protein
MFDEIIKAYADALCVATTLRPPVSASAALGGKPFAACSECRRSRVSSRLAGWLRASPGRRIGAATGSTAPPLPAFVRSPRP